MVSAPLCPFVYPTPDVATLHHNGWVKRGKYSNRRQLALLEQFKDSSVHGDFQASPCPMPKPHVSVIVGGGRVKNDWVRTAPIRALNQMPDTRLVSSLSSTYRKDELCPASFHPLCPYLLFKNQGVSFNWQEDEKSNEVSCPNCGGAVYQS